MFESLCKVGTFLKLSWNRIRSPNNKNCAATKNGNAGATTGDHSPVHIGDNYYGHPLKSEISPESRFRNRLVAVANELPFNFQDRGNAQNPFLMKALEKLVHDEPMIHNDPELFQKASNCLNIAQTLSSALPHHPRLKPSNGQFFMKELAEYIFAKYGIKGSSQA